MFTKRFCVRSPYWAKRPVSICLDPPRQHHALHGHSAWIGTSGFWRGWTLRPSLCGREVGSGYAVPYRLLVLSAGIRFKNQRVR